MGMFTNDVLFGGDRLDQVDWLTIGETAAESTPVLLLDAAIVSDEVPTELGKATKTNLLFCPINEDMTAGNAVMVGTLASAIGEKVKLKEAKDLPAVVCFMTVETKYDSDATVMQFVRRWDGPVPTFEPLADGIPF